MTILLETKRLILKPLSLEDVDDIYALRSDPVVMKYIDDGSVWNREKVEEWVKNGVDSGYYKKYGLDFFSVFEKLTGTFVGQAGLFHVRFNVNSPDIELAYRFHKKYWNLGYATEISKALIDYGFRKLSLPKIIAMVHQENTRSRRVLEKAGMSYVGLVDYREGQWPCYEIYNPTLNISKISLVPAKKVKDPVIQMKFYYAKGTIDDRDFLDDKLVEYNSKYLSITDKKIFTPIDYNVKDENGKIIAGITSNLYAWGCLYIDTLWVDTPYRNQKIGSKLLDMVEVQAKEMGCRVINLNTFDFQGKDFYIKKGYQIFGELEECAPGHKLYFLKKSL